MTSTAWQCGWAEYHEPSTDVWWCTKDDHYGGPYRMHQKCPHCEREKRTNHQDSEPHPHQ